MGITLNQLTNSVNKVMIKVKDKFVSKEEGKGLSTNDYSTEDKSKVAKIDDIENSVKNVSSQIDEIATTGTTVETVQNTVKELAEAGEIQAYTIADKSIVASNKIADGSITQELLDKNVKFGIDDGEITLKKLNNSILGRSIEISGSAKAWLELPFIKLDKKITETSILKISFKLISSVNIPVLGISTDQYQSKVLSLRNIYKGEEIKFEGLLEVKGMQYLKFFTNTAETRSVDGIYSDFKITINDVEVDYSFIISDNIKDITEELSPLVSKKYLEKSLENINLSDEIVSFRNLNKQSMFGESFELKGTTKPFPNAVIAKLDKTYGAGQKLRIKFNYFPIRNFTLVVGTNQYQSPEMGFWVKRGIKNIIDCTLEMKNNFNEIRISENSNNENSTVDGYCENLTIYIDGNKVKYTVPEKQTLGEAILTKDSNLSFASTEYVDEAIYNIKNGSVYKPDYKLPFVNNLYVVQGSKRKYSVPIFIDYLYNGYTDKILFENGEDRTYIRETTGGGNTQSTNINNKKETLKYKSDNMNVQDTIFNKISIRENTSNGKIFILIIGDSVTAGAITNKQYWAVAREFFAKEDIDLKRTSNVMFLGSNNCRTETLEYGEITKEIKSCACGISSWSLTNWLTSASSHFVYDKDGTPTFSILKWIERYRTHDDNGNKLELGQGTGTLITSDNIDKIQCCTPNIVYINSTHNGGSIEQHEQMIEIIRSEIPDCKIIVGNPMPLTGTWHKEKYVGIDWLDDANITGPNYNWGGEYGSSRIASLKYYIDKEKKNDWFFFMPQCVTMPTVEALEYDLVDCGVKQMKQVTKLNQLPKEHPSTLTHKIWGYELYALLKYISAINSETTTTNVVSVTLDTTEKTLNVEETFTLVATPSTEGTTVIFSSTNENIASVDSNGLVTAISEGECEIYAETSTSIFPAICKITVNVITESTESSDS